MDPVGGDPECEMSSAIAPTNYLLCFSQFTKPGKAKNKKDKLEFGLVVRVMSLFNGFVPGTHVIKCPKSLGMKRVRRLTKHNTDWKIVTQQQRCATALPIRSTTLLLPLDDTLLKPS